MPPGFEATATPFYRILFSPSYPGNDTTLPSQPTAGVVNHNQNADNRNHNHAPRYPLNHVDNCDDGYWSDNDLSENPIRHVSNNDDVHETMKPSRFQQIVEWIQAFFQSLRTRLREYFIEERASSNMQVILHSTNRLSSAPFNGSLLSKAMESCSDALSISNMQYSILAETQYNDITSVITKTLAQHGLVGEVLSLYSIGDSTPDLAQVNKVKEYHTALVNKAKEINTTLKVDILGKSEKKAVYDPLPEPSISFCRQELRHGHENEDIAQLAYKKMCSEGSPVVLVFTVDQCADAFTGLDPQIPLSIDCAVLTKGQANGKLFLSKYNKELDNFSALESIQMRMEGGEMMVAGKVPQIIDPEGMQTTFGFNDVMIHGKSVVMASIFSEQTATWRERAEKMGVVSGRVKSQDASPESASGAQQAGVPPLIIHTELA